MGSNKYSNIFISKSCYEGISEYICIQKVDTNEYPNIFVSKKWYERISEYIFGSKIFEYSNIRIYSSHSGAELFSDSAAVSIIISKNVFTSVGSKRKQMTHSNSLFFCSVFFWQDMYRTMSTPQTPTLHTIKVSLFKT